METMSDQIAERSARAAEQPKADPLTALRGWLDAIDTRLLTTLHERFTCCGRIALVKREYEIPMMQPARVSLVIDRARQYAQQHELDPVFMAGLYEAIVAETCRFEDRIIGGH